MKSERKSTFIQEYLYIEEIPLEYIEKEKIKKDQSSEIDRGVFVIDLFNDKE